mgnify:CR=1 FL=1|tara:strand:- start:584 stop:802 length:219 start_codon:yes stop_codon:yes gene_type:complete
MNSPPNKICFLTTTPLILVGLLKELCLRKEGFLDSQAVRSMWQAHLSGERRWHYPLWCVLMFQAWLGEQRGG